MEQISKKLFNWASILDDQTREQAIKTADLVEIRHTLRQIINVKGD